MAILSLLALLLKGYGVSVASETGGLLGVSPKANPAPVAPPHAADSHLFLFTVTVDGGGTGIRDRGG